MKKISILIADDHLLLREMWTHILNSDFRFGVIGSTGNGEEAIEIATNQMPDIILMDISMSPIDGFEATRQITSYQTVSKIIGVSMHNILAYAKRLINAGAKGYLTKNSSKEEMINAILEVNSGRKYICDEILNMISKNEFAISTDLGINNLTAREIDILSCIKQGFSSREIGLQLDVCTKTIEVHRYHILKKLKMKNTAALVNFANMNGI